VAAATVSAVLSPNTVMNEVKVFAGEVALDGSNPTPLSPFPFSTVLAGHVSPKVSVGSGTVSCSYTFSGGVLNIYGWLAAGTASTGTETVGFVFYGY